jgi:D-3-phosphoglycerate dehydrogenase
VPESLLAVARAGAGVNNVPVAEYSKLGIVVFNTPGANANAVKELVMAGMLLSRARHRRPAWPMFSRSPTSRTRRKCPPLLEKEKARFAGGEIKGKTLGIVGLGAIGSMVAEMALAMGMKVVGFDPVLSIDAAWRLSNEVSAHGEPAGAAGALRLRFAARAGDRCHPAHDQRRHPGRHQARRGPAQLRARNDRRLGRGAAVASTPAGSASYVCDFPEPAFCSATPRSSPCRTSAPAPRSPRKTAR